MIKNIALNFNDAPFTRDLKLVAVQNDTIVLNVTVDGVELADYKIRATIWNNGQSIRLANTASGGSDSQIAEVSSDSGMSAFQVVFPAGRTENFYKYSVIEIEVEDTDSKVFTLLQQQLTFLDEKIDWTDPA